MSERDYILGFSSYLFWDILPDSLSLETNASYVVQRVLEYGRWNDWKLLVSYYGLDRIVQISMNLRTLDPKALGFISVISSTSLEQFRCYTTKQSHPIL